MLNIQRINQLLIAQSHRILALMLLSLHAFLMLNQVNPLDQAVFLCHYGLFLMWQPIWHNTEKLSKLGILVIFAFACIAFVLINWWLTAIWMAMLIGLLGGRIFADESKSNRAIHILAASYLLAMLLLWVVPKLLGAFHDLEAATFTITYLMPLLPAAILFLGRQHDNPRQQPIIDFFYTLMLTLIALILVLASYAVGSQNQVNYIQVMFITIFGIALSLIVLSFLWKPSTRFSGVELLMSRYLLSIGMPFEMWVKNISNLGEIESNPASFLQGAMREMNLLPWVSGVSWLTDASEGQLGTASTHTNQFHFKDLHMTLYSRWQISPALYVHAKLLTQIMGEFYEAKRREEAMRQNAYMQAFYESGSRLTHDIKNILQSVGTLVTAAANTDDTDSAALINLIRRQLPLLNQRIAATLDKLKAPGELKKRSEKIAAWWKGVQLRHAQANVDFYAQSLPTVEINAEVLDSVLDNLISNATEKAKYEPNIQIAVHLYALSDTQFNIDVTDTGKAISPLIEKDLFKKHISSHNGLGVGLYHAAQDAKQAGYALTLAQNSHGAVCFRLSL